VVIRLVPELLLQLRHLRERMLEAAVLEQDARMAGEGPEELDIGVGERADVAEALADDKQPERPVLALERGNDRVLEAARTKECVESVGGAAPREERGRADRGDLAEGGGLLGRKPLLRMHEQLAPCPADAPQRPFLVGGREEKDLRVLGPEEPPCCDEKLPDGQAELRRALRRAHRLVQELHMLPLLALLHVAAEGCNGGEDRNDEQEDGEWPNLEQRHDGKAE